MHPDDEPRPRARAKPAGGSLLDRAKMWLASRLGTHYAAVIETADRALLAAGTAFAGKAIGSGLDIPHLVNLSYWQTAAVAGITAGLAVLQAALSAWLTGAPQLLAPVSRTLRYRRDVGLRPMHRVPVRPPKDHR